MKSLTSSISNSKKLQLPGALQSKTLHTCAVWASFGYALSKNALLASFRCFSVHLFFFFMCCECLMCPAQNQMQEVPPSFSCSGIELLLIVKSQFPLVKKKKYTRHWKRWLPDHLLCQQVSPVPGQCRHGRKVPRKAAIVSVMWQCRSMWCEGRDYFV